MIAQVVSCHDEVRLLDFCYVTSQLQLLARIIQRLHQQYPDSQIGTTMQQVWEYEEHVLALLSQVQEAGVALEQFYTSEDVLDDLDGLWELCLCCNRFAAYVLLECFPECYAFFCSPYADEIPDELSDKSPEFCSWYQDIIFSLFTSEYQDGFLFRIPDAVVQASHTDLVVAQAIDRLADLFFSPGVSVAEYVSADGGERWFFYSFDSIIEEYSCFLPFAEASVRAEVLSWYLRVCAPLCTGTVRREVLEL